MTFPNRILVLSALGLCVASLAHAHGNVTPQAVDTSELEKLGDEWLEANPYSGNAKAIEVGKSGYSQNCARCHGLEVVSGGIAPDLRLLTRDCVSLRSPRAKKKCMKDMDAYFVKTVRNGRTQNGVYKMPPFEGVLEQEAIWAIKSYIETQKPDEAQ